MTVAAMFVLRGQGLWVVGEVVRRCLWDKEGQSK